MVSNIFNPKKPKEYFCENSNDSGWLESDQSFQIQSYQNELYTGI